MTESIAAIQNFGYLGESLALASAFIWAVAIILFRISGKTVHPVGLNFFKNFLALILFTITILVIDKSFFPEAPWESYALLLCSGVLGMGLSDTLFFASLNRLGAGLSAIVNCTYSPFVIILSTVFIAEKMSPFQLLGVVFIVSAVLTISQKNIQKKISTKDMITGISLGISAMLVQAVSIVMIKPLLNNSPLLWATQVRTAGGLVFLCLVLFFHPKRLSIWKDMFHPKTWFYMGTGTFIGAYIGLACWMGGMKFTQASVASALNQTNTIFVFILGMIILKEEATKGKFLALFLAILGVFLVTFL